MNRRAIPYKGMWLFPGSDAFQLYTDGKFEKLEKHLKEVNQRYKELLINCDKKEEKMCKT